MKNKKERVKEEELIKLALKAEDGLIFTMICCLATAYLTALLIYFTS